MTVASSFVAPQDHPETHVGKPNEFAATKWLVDLGRRELPDAQGCGE